MQKMKISFIVNKVGSPELPVKDCPSVDFKENYISKQINKSSNVKLFFITHNKNIN